MPIYEYLCQSCQFQFEEWSPKIGELAPQFLPCSKCQGEALRFMSSFGSYEIKGNNSASTKPRSTLLNKK